MFPRATIIAATLASVVCVSHAAPKRQVDISPEKVKAAIDRTVEYILSKRGEDGSWPPYVHEVPTHVYPVGPTALAAYALMEAGISPTDEKMAKTLAWLGSHDSNRTYDYGFRACAWNAANSKTGNKYMKQLEKDVAVLIKSTAEGGYNYACMGDGKSGKGDWDHSNSQVGLLGVWAGKLSNLESIPDEYWWKAMKFWIDTQNNSGDGGGYYSDSIVRPTASMTAASIASMFVCYDSVFSREFANCNQGSKAEMAFRPITRALGWMDKNFEQTVWNAAPYYLYAVERVGLASGYKYFGTCDWYEMLMQKAITYNLADWQKGNVAKDGGTANACFTLLFMVRGLHPVLFNKLEYDGDWYNRPRELASLTRWIGKSFESTVNWQIVNLKVKPEDWQDAPILYISGSKAPKFSDEDIQKIRTYVLEGGTILSCTGCGGDGFKTGMRKAYGKIFPEYELVQLPPEHPLYSAQVKLHGKPVFYGFSNGVRLLAIHTDDDLALQWQQQSYATQTWAFEAAANVFVYVTDKMSDLRARGANVWPEAADAAANTMKLAQVKYNGNFNPEPLALEHFSRLMARDCKLKLDVSQVAAKDLPAGEAKLAFMTGTAKYTFSDDEKKALKDFVSSGGTLVIDAAGASKAFIDTVEPLLKELFGQDNLKRLPASSSVYSAEGNKIDKVDYRRKAKSLFPERQPNLFGVEVNGRVGVYVSREDMTEGLLGCPSYECVGYAPDSAFAIMRNIVLLSQATTTAPAK